MKKTKGLNKLSFAELQEEVEKLKREKENATTKEVGVWQVGKNYVLRTVTMIQVGKLVAVDNQELVLETAAWVADTGRWADFLTKGKVNEVEPFPEGRVIVGRNSIIDACIWKHDLLTKQV